MSWLLIEAAQEGHVKEINRLFKKGVNIHIVDKEVECSLIGWAAECKDGSKAIILLEELGLDVNARDKDGRTPVYTAALKGHIQTIKTLGSVKKFSPQPYKYCDEV